jgi:5-methylthioadenosine/S-adenosylhomocysteine deaminase
MATLDGARALGLEDEIGSLETGKRADVTVIALDRLHLTPRPDIISTIVYAAEAADVRTVLVDGQVLLHDGTLTTLDERETIKEALEQYRLLADRAGV